MLTRLASQMQISAKHINSLVELISSNLDSLLRHAREYEEIAFNSGQATLGVSEKHSLVE